jgi:hypothetical protein
MKNPKQDKKRVRRLKEWVMIMNLVYQEKKLVGYRMARRVD